MSEIYNYTDYRKYLKDFFNTKKSKKESFSYAIFAKQAGFKSRTFIFKVINGQKSLPRASVHKFADAMKLIKKEREYFENMVFFNEAKTLSEKDYYFVRLTGVNRTHKAVILNKDKYEYFGKWYYPVLREMISLFNFKEDYKMLGEMLFPAITKQMAKHGVELLLRLDLIKKENNKYVSTNTTITTGDEINSFAVQKYHKENINNAGESISNCPRELRDISCVTVSVNTRGFEIIKSEIQSFRKKILELSANFFPSDRVYQLNLQLFPYTQDLKVASKQIVNDKF